MRYRKIDTGIVIHELSGVFMQQTQNSIIYEHFLFCFDEIGWKILIFFLKLQPCNQLKVTANFLLFHVLKF